MKSKKYILSRKAKSDLENIWLYSYNKWSRDQADRYFQVIQDEIKNIAINPLIGKSMDHIKEGYRASVVKSHIIFYSSQNAYPIKIIRILHQKMDAEKKL